MADLPAGLATALSAHEARGGIFDLAPVSLWAEEFSGVKKLTGDRRVAGVTSLRAHLTADLSRVAAKREHYAQTESEWRAAVTQGIALPARLR